MAWQTGNVRIEESMYNVSPSVPRLDLNSDFTGALDPACTDAVVGQAVMDERRWPVSLFSLEQLLAAVAFFA